MKTKEELNELKKEYENVKSKLSELSEDELKEVTGGYHCGINANSGTMIHAPTFGAVADTAPYIDTGLSSDVNNKEIKVD